VPIESTPGGRGVDPDPNDTIGTFDTREQLEGAVEHPYTFDATVMSVIGTPDGESPVTPRTDGGGNWGEAELFGPDDAGAWRLFRYDWDAGPGTHVVLSRATDERNRR